MSFRTASHDDIAHRTTGPGALVDRLGHDPLTMLAVWAHPDDESYLGAGLMAEVARRGGRVVSVTATLGEHGTPDPEVDPPEHLAVRRNTELQRALDVLGVAEGRALGFTDGTCEHVADAIGARRVGAIIEEIRPDVVLSFGPDGVTGHPDHRAVSRWTRLAVRERADRLPLLTTAVGATWPSWMVERMHRVDAFWPGFPHRFAGGPTWPVTLQGRPLDQKLDALGCHESQIGPLHDELGADDYRRLAAIESYRPANPAAAHRLCLRHRRRAA